MDWIQQHFTEAEGFPRPNWEAIYECVDKDHKEIDKHELWTNIARAWMERLKTRLPAEYALHESDNFILVTSETDKYVKNFLGFLEQTLKKIMRTLQGIASDDGYGKYVVLIFDDIDSYYSYLSYFYPEEGVFGTSSGIFISAGYGHFAFPYQDIAIAEDIAAHEMTHALLSHLPIPLWLNEGLAVNIENHLTGSAQFRLDNEMIHRHQEYWGVAEVQEFWVGASFGRADEGQELSYHLAQFAVNALSQDYDTFVQFTNKAHYSDGGESAANEVYEGSLGGLLTNLLGDEDWSPKPESWNEEHGLTIKG